MPGKKAPIFNEHADAKENVVQEETSLSNRTYLLLFTYIYNIHIYIYIYTYINTQIIYIYIVCVCVCVLGRFCWGSRCENGSTIQNGEDVTTQIQDDVRGTTYGINWHGMWVSACFEAPTIHPIDPTYAIHISRACWDPRP